MPPVGNWKNLIDQDARVPDIDARVPVQDARVPVAVTDIVASSTHIRMF
jgi:hypothetical protein